ncbi:MAG: NADH-quinone oxidoreductase subunit C [Candidatus Aquicultorales bacterium]
MAKFDLEALVSKFSGSIEESAFETIARVPRENYRAFCEALKMEGCELSSITAVDRVEKLEVVAHILAAPAEQITVKADIPVDDPKVDSLYPVWAGSEWQERETYDMYGITFTDHPDLTRILLVDDFEGHPLRKSYELEEVPW